MDYHKHIRLSARGVVVRDERILMVQYIDESGLHYNLPGGGVDFCEPMRDAVRREVKEETMLDVTVGDLLLTYEHIEPESQVNAWHSVSFFFRCEPVDGSTASLPPNPDPNETAVVWMPYDEFRQCLLYPMVNDHILQALKRKFSQFIETIPIAPDQYQ
ncbi:MAG: NUDIX domain-containing protein [Chloroflexi bacterium]|nr:NUDIX domain-containing protein [Chloroflexota bacterium]